MLSLRQALPQAPFQKNHWKRELSTLVAGRKIVLAVGTVDKSLGFAQILRSLGSSEPFILSDCLGAAEGPTPENLRILCGASPNVWSSYREFQQKLLNLPKGVLRTLDDYDPKREALVLRGSSMFDVGQIGGRPTFAPRHESWARLEDKTRIDRLWDAIGVRRPPSQIVALKLDAIRKAISRLDRGFGTVWSADAKCGYHGWGHGVRWVAGGAREIKRTIASLRGLCDRVRISPFLNGIPCSIHGIVFPDGTVIALRPMEMLSFRRRGFSDFVFAGFGSYWDPCAFQSERMRKMAREVGAYLSLQYSYRGTFTMDGILSDEGFLPTELNPRYGSAMNLYADAVPDLPLQLLDMAIRQGIDLDYRPKALESWLLSSVEKTRAIGGWTWVQTRFKSVQKIPLLLTSRGCRTAPSEKEADVILGLAPSPMGGMLRLSLRNKSELIGHSVAPVVATVLGWCDRSLNTSFGSLIPAEEAMGRKE